VKRCPTCNRSFDDDTLSFCLEDGTPLVTDSAGSRNLQETLVSPPPSVPGSGSQSYNLPGKSTVSSSLSQIPFAQPYGPAAQRKTWPWVVAILAVLFIVIVVVVLIAVGLPAIMRASNNDNRPQPTPTQPDNKATPTPGRWSSGNEDDLPTDKDEVLAQLSKLEDEWERANVTADKQAMNTILADDFIDADNSNTKQQYIASLEQDTSVRSWEFQNLTVDQNGDRATVHGKLTVQTKPGPLVYEFTDNFVWRDHRWQAVSSTGGRVK
jgi:hypothetical protein